MDYVGEHTWIGELGTALVVVAFVSAITAGVAYFISSRLQAGEAWQWRKLGRTAFTVHGFGVIAVMGVLFYLLFNQYYEYHYVWQHSNNRLPLRYIFSCFWEGQEGSFLLWAFWHVVLGGILMKVAGKFWEAPVMTVFSGVQMLILSMLLGIYIGDFQYGSDPFILVRELPQNLGAPWTSDPQYLQQLPFFEDGQGLNPILQNYWMTIHPPVLFLGFASTLVPFAFAIGGLWKKRFGDWVKPAIPWAYFSVMALSTGILMGGAWAYEALSFGGFWAWDPVENASLVPWIVMVGAAHLMIVYKKRGKSLFTTLLLTLFSFILVMYSTFLTRSGILGDTSVHSFTSDGMLAQLLVFLLLFVALSAFLMLRENRERAIYAAGSVFLLIAGFLLWDPRISIGVFLLFTIFSFMRAYGRYYMEPRSEEEHVWSREFWIFVGSLVLILSAVQITASTSLPVVNELLKPFSGSLAALHEATGVGLFQKLSEAELSAPENVQRHYNGWQTVFAFLICLFVGGGQFLRYRQTSVSRFFRKIGVSLAGALVLTVGIAWALAFGFKQPQYLFLLFATLFAIVANLDYFRQLGQGRFDRAGSSIAHAGFGVLLLGALISQYKGEPISRNTSMVDVNKVNEEFSNREDLFISRHDTLRMGDYFVTYRGKEQDGVNVSFLMDYFKSVPRTYQEGDTVVVRGKAFVAQETHTAGSSFLEDQDKWKEVNDPAHSIVRYSSWKSGAPGEKAFTLRPNVKKNPDFGNVAEPATKHFLHKDLYTHVQYGDLETDPDTSGYSDPRSVEVEVGDTIPTTDHIAVLTRITGNVDHDKHKLLPNDMAAKAVLKVHGRDGETYTAEPLYIIRDSSLVVPDEAVVEEAGLKFRLASIDPDSKKLTIELAERNSPSRDFIVVKALVFPWINILWIGCILMILGTGLAIRNRVKNGPQSSGVNVSGVGERAISEKERSQEPVGK